MENKIEPLDDKISDSLKNYMEMIKIIEEELKTLLMIKE